MKGFLDTNVLVYAFQPDDGKADKAFALLNGANYLGVQSLNEFALAARRRLRMQWPEINRALAVLQDLVPKPVPLTLDIHRGGIGLAERYDLGIYDSLLLSAALSIGCSIFWSEDMHDGLVIDGRLTIRNPFV
ncbi:PIN domain-containing protein [Sandaracinobacter neustonicus]|uniref:PIN domain-containing protein n=1 Tax=Sandaracinobacter neustonicus TaxID=1715348 RepID=UPI0015E3009D|nr:PIN domain-containing protein [Sandaracinobacter neustonicus]